MVDSTLPFPNEPFSRSEPIQPSRIKETGAFTRFAARINHANDLADEGTRRARSDYSALVGHVASHDASESAVGNFNSLMYFDCLPDRIEMLSYLTELAFLHDGMPLSIHAPSTSRRLTWLRLHGRGSGRISLQYTQALGLRTRSTSHRDSR